MLRNTRQKITLANIAVADNYTMCFGAAALMSMIGTANVISPDLGTAVSFSFMLAMLIVGTYQICHAAFWAQPKMPQNEPPQPFGPHLKPM